MLKKIQNNINSTYFWSLPTETVFNILKSNFQTGLSETEADQRLKVQGLNVIKKTKRVTWFSVLINQLKSPLILVLIFAGLILLLIEHQRDSFFIFIAVIVNATLGFYQEYKAEKALAELESYIKQRSRVVREGVEYEIDSDQLVPGDIIRLSQGDRVPADARLIYVNDFQVDEAVLTGESLPEAKNINPVSKNTVLADQISMVFAGTLVTQGIGSAIICQTGLNTELGKIAQMVADSQSEETPLQVAIKKLSLKSSLILGLLTIIIFIIGVNLGYSKIDMFLTSVAIAVSAVPEGLPIAMTVILAVGVERMAKRKGVIRRLMTAEALGGATVVMTDKTGTLTLAKMEINQILPVSNDINEDDLLRLALINADVLIENKNDPISDWRISGRTLEVAMVKSAAKRKIFLDEVKNSIKIINYLPFNAVNKFSVSLISKSNNKSSLVFFGAPETLIRSSSASEKEKGFFVEKVNNLASQGDFVIGIATKDINPKTDFSFSQDLDLSNLKFQGFVALRDSIRPKIGQVIKQVQKAGIRVMIVTGDHLGTAVAVAKEVGLESDEGNVIDASVMRELSDLDLIKRLPNLRVISRVSPIDKMRLVKLLQAQGETVAMTGDGVNDSPSIKQADIGIAMGSGTEIAKEVADLVLLDDNFETIVVAIQEGRQIMSNIRKVIIYLLSNVSTELLLIGGALLTGLNLPLNALQLLYVNFFSDSFPAIAFAFEKGIDGLGVRSLSLKKTGLFDPLMKFLILVLGVLTSISLFVIYWVMIKIGLDGDLTRSFIFMSFGTYTLFMTFSLRSLEKSIFKYNILSNKFLLGGVVIGTFLMCLAIYWSPLQTLLDTTSLPPVWLVGLLIISLVNIFMVEIAKWFYHKKVN